MDELREQLQGDLKAAMKAQDRWRVATLRMVMSAIKQEEVDRRTEITDQDITAVLKREIKRRREAIQDAEKAGRPDLIQSEQAEIELLESYLPRQLSEAEITEMARAAIAESGAASPKEMGKVMSVLMPRIAGRADGKLVNQVVRQLLGA